MVKQQKQKEPLSDLAATFINTRDKSEKCLLLSSFYTYETEGLRKLNKLFKVTHESEYIYSGPFAFNIHSPLNIPHPLHRALLTQTEYVCVYTCVVNSK